MFKSIWEDVKKEFSYGNMLTRIIIVNAVFFLLINLVKLGLKLSNNLEIPPIYDDILHFFCMSSNCKHVVTHPWVLLTDMFLHEGFWHLLWNMLFLLWFGRIVGDFIGNHRILPIYLMGGLVGNIIYFISANFLPNVFFAPYALGASASVMAIITAAGTISPDYIIRVLLIGDVKLKYVVFVLVLLDLLAIGSDGNTGGHLAHLGGALFGWFFIRQLQVGNDWSAPINRVLNSITDFFERINNGGEEPTQRPRPRMAAYKNTEYHYHRKNAPTTNIQRKERPEMSHQEQLDAILDKIKRTGYNSLNTDEKEFLFKASKD